MFHQPNELVPAEGVVDLVFLLDGLVVCRSSWLSLCEDLADACAATRYQGSAKELIIVEFE